MTVAVARGTLRDIMTLLERQPQKRQVASARTKAQVRLLRRPQKKMMNLNVSVPLCALGPGGNMHGILERVKSRFHQLAAISCSACAP